MYLFFLSINSLIFLSKLIPIVAHKVKLMDETLVADHVARPLPVGHTVTDLEIIDVTL